MDEEVNLPPELLNKSYGPRAGTKYDPVVLVAQVEAYIQDTEYPIIKEFCGRIGISYITLKSIRDRHEFVEDAIQKLLNKAECYIERGALHKRLDGNFAQFRLKQKGFNWDDKHQIETSSADNVDIRSVTKKELQDRLKELISAVKDAEE